MPTPEQIRAAHPDIFGPSVQGEVGGAAPVAATSAANAAPSTSPSWAQRIKSAITSRPVMGTLGAEAALSLLAPEAGIPAMMATMGAGGVAGGFASKVLNNEPATAGSMAEDAAMGASGPLVGPAARGAAKALRYTGEMMPKAARTLGYLGGLYTGHPAVLGIEAAINPKGLPRALDAGGNAVDKLLSTVKGSGNWLLNKAEPAIRPLGSHEVPYRMPSGTSEAGTGLSDLAKEGSVLINWRHPAAASSVDDMLSGLTNAAEKAPESVTTGARPPASYVHPADTSGGKFGFENLPKISESELARLQNSFGRMKR